MPEVDTNSVVDALIVELEQATTDMLQTTKASILAKIEGVADEGTALEVAIALANEVERVRQLVAKIAILSSPDNESPPYIQLPDIPNNESHMAKITCLLREVELVDEDIIKILLLLKKEGYMQVTIAEGIGTKQSNISKIVNGKRTMSDQLKSRFIGWLRAEFKIE